ncbi:MAG: bifunctional phosphopantothenoylcysteine decarboxylase/phosphopantothenate--cysteine ligase CoaBC [Fibrobacteraceae bacterium]|nr:bifunctional phosphopantothenoylcysteine decarboxylase/phosphopantothenate--cysteine ligase CoaBC [Fibrobacteraceae bacterium]
MVLSQKKILLGVTGSIAAYKACELLRLLQKEGAEVRVTMTSAAREFVAPLSFASLSKCPVYMENGAAEARPFQHIDFPRWADLYLVAPCSADMIGKMANGLADDPVSLCFMSSTCEKWIAPAMNSAMFASPAVQANLARLKSFEGVTLLESPSGDLACGETGPGRFMEPADIVRALGLAKSAKGKKDPARSVLITAGRTEEPIDPVRYISNRSSGKTAVAIAEAFLGKGFDVTLVHGPMDVKVPFGVEDVRIGSSREMYGEVLDREPLFDALVHCAAVADYRPKMVAESKIKDSRSQFSLELVANPNVLRDSVAHKRPHQVIVGFALETDNAQKNAEEKLEKSGADLLVLNTPVAAHSGFGFDDVSFAFVEKGKTVPELSLGAKTELASRLANFVVEKLEAFGG